MLFCVSVENSLLYTLITNKIVVVEWLDKTVGRMATEDDIEYNLFYYQVKVSLNLVLKC